MMRVVGFAWIAILLASAGCNSSSTKIASEDPARVVGGEFYAVDEPKPIDAGQFFLTDLMVDGEPGSVFVAKDPSCKEQDFKLVEWRAGAGETTVVDSHHGMRFFIPQGRTLCARSWRGARIVWAGFRP